MPHPGPPALWVKVHSRSITDTLWKESILCIVLYVHPQCCTQASAHPLLLTVTLEVGLLSTTVYEEGSGSFDNAGSTSRWLGINSQLSYVLCACAFWHVSSPVKNKKRMAYYLIELLRSEKHIPNAVPWKSKPSMNVPLLVLSLATNKNS